MKKKTPMKHWLKEKVEEGRQRVKNLFRMAWRESLKNSKGKWY